jgi:hypothetical protein
MNRTYALIATLAIAFTGCVDVHHHGATATGQQWVAADLMKQQAGMVGEMKTGKNNCTYKMRDNDHGTYTINGMACDCPAVVEIDVNSYVVHIDPLIQSEKFQYRPACGAAGATTSTVGAGSPVTAPAK